uniref:Uncharacterized protein n=1 Tax=Arundo donax TaxID=35708 RepID=A0A0A9D8X8_ARUDO
MEIRIKFQRKSSRHTWIPFGYNGVHLALYTEKTASESICCYPWLHVSCHTVG